MLPVDACSMAWFFRVIEQDDGRWACRHGRQVFDTHLLLDEAIEHIRALAARQLPAQLFLHRRDGTIEGLEFE
jgi:hypothetical protein